MSLDIDGLFDVAVAAVTELDDALYDGDRAAVKAALDAADRAVHAWLDAQEETA